MSTATVALSNTRIERSPAHTATIYLKEAKYEFLKNLRLRMYTASVLSFPIMFYVLFGLVLNSKESIAGTPIPAYLIATYGTFGVMGASLFGTASGLASDSGLLVPFQFLRKIVRQIALGLPPYHLSQLALGIGGAGRHESNATHWEVLAAFTMICLGVARIGFQRDQDKMYG